MLSIIIEIMHREWTLDVCDQMFWQGFLQVKWHVYWSDKASLVSFPSPIHNLSQLFYRWYRSTLHFVFAPSSPPLHLSAFFFSFSLVYMFNIHTLASSLLVCIWVDPEYNKLTRKNLSQQHRNDSFYSSFQPAVCLLS